MEGELHRRSVSEEKTGEETKKTKDYSYKTLWGYFDQEIKWFNVFFFFLAHLYALHLFISIRPYMFPMICWGVFCSGVAGFGVTGGAHRYFTHKSYKANFPLRVILMLTYSAAGQNSLYEWVRDHRVHHKFTETDADPHNAKRGFFFAHCGWLMLKKHPDVVTKGKAVDCSDILNDPVVQFHQKYFQLLRILLCFVVPTMIPVYFWGYGWKISFDVAFGRWICLLNGSWAVNSVAHLWGTKPYNKDLNPVETKIVSLFTMGEGWHNYHHTFPWDYKAAEFSYYINATTFWIDFFAALGWAYDLKQPSKEIVRRTAQKFGDGSHFEKKLETLGEVADELSDVDD